MAYVDQNDIIVGLRGKFGKQFIFRRFGDRTIAVRRTNPVQPNTEKQLRHRERFRLAARYARNSFLLPDLKAHYEAVARVKRNTTPFAVAVGDYLAPGTITKIITNDYHGNSGDRIFIVVNDVFKVKSMRIAITDATGSIIETGNATRHDGASTFEYLGTTTIPGFAGMSLKVEVTDWPGKKDEMQVKF